MKTDELKQKLLDEKQLLETEIAGVGVADPHDPGGFTAHEGDQHDENPDEDLDLAMEQENFGNNHAILGELETRLGNIEMALDAIEAGTYGTCMSCEGPIEQDRLEANPAAVTCTECME